MTKKAATKRRRARRSANKALVKRTKPSGTKRRKPRSSQGRTNLNTDLGEVIYRLYRGAVLTRFFSADAKDAELAQKLMDGVAKDLSIRKSEAESKTTPVELIDPSWFNLMVSWQHLSLADESPENPDSDESDKEISFQEI